MERRLGTKKLEDRSQKEVAGAAACIIKDVRPIVVVARRSSKEGSDEVQQGSEVVVLEKS